MKIFNLYIFLVTTYVLGSIGFNYMIKAHVEETQRKVEFYSSERKSQIELIDKKLDRLIERRSLIQGIDDKVDLLLKRK
jgi:hypothetical protein